MPASRAARKMSSIWLDSNRWQPVWTATLPEEANPQGSVPPGEPGGSAMTAAGLVLWTVCARTPPSTIIFRFGAPLPTAVCSASAISPSTRNITTAAAGRVVSPAPSPRPRSRGPASGPGSTRGPRRQVMAPAPANRCTRSRSGQFSSEPWEGVQEALRLAPRRMFALAPRSGEREGRGAAAGSLTIAPLPDPLPAARGEGKQSWSHGIQPRHPTPSTRSERVPPAPRRYAPSKLGSHASCRPPPARVGAALALDAILPAWRPLPRYHPHRRTRRSCSSGRRSMGQRAAGRRHHRHRGADRHLLAGAAGRAVHLPADPGRDRPRPAGPPPLPRRRGDGSAVPAPDRHAGGHPPPDPRLPGGARARPRRRGAGRVHRAAARGARQPGRRARIPAAPGGDL